MWLEFAALLLALWAVWMRLHDQREWGQLAAVLSAWCSGAARRRARTRARASVGD